MATIDPSIAMGYKPVQIENPLNQLAAYSQIQGAQQGQQMNMLKIREAEQEMADRNALRGIPGGINDPDYIANVAKINPKLALTLQKDLAAYKESGLKNTGLELKNFTDSMSQYRNALDMVRTPEALLAWQDAIHKDPLTGSRLASMGIPYDSVKQQLMAELQRPGGFEAALTQAKLGATRFAELNKPQVFQENLGGTNRVSTLPGMGGAPTIVSDTTKTPTIADKISQGNLNLAQNKALREQTMGTIPAGYRLSADGTSLEPIPGGPTTVPLAPKELQAREAKFPQATQALKTFDSTSDNLIKDLERLKNHSGLSNITGVIAGRTPSLTVQGREAQALYDKIIARGGFQELQSLRQSSPTGGALGNVSNQEGQSLRQAFGALDRTQDASSIRNEITRLIENIGGAKDRVREAYDMTYDYKNTTPRSNATAPATPNAATVNIKSNAEYDALPSGTIFVDPNGQQRRKP
jgi:hypothetical protein